MIKTIYICDCCKKEFEGEGVLGEGVLNEAFIASKISSRNGKIETATIELCQTCSKEFVKICNKFIGKEG